MSTINEAAWELLDAMREAEFAKGSDEQQYARQDVMQSAEKLRKVLAVLPPAMTWTTDKPVKEGWYWWKDKWSHAAPVHVLAYATEKEDVLCFRPPIGPERRVNSDTGDWAGPLAPPMEPPQ